MNEFWIWVFHGAGASLSSAVFSDIKNAEEWIEINKISGTLTKMPCDKSIYQWAIEYNFFHPKNDNQKTGKFIQKFSSAYLEHYHYTDGIRSA